MDPAHVIETANELRGIGTKRTKTNTVRKVTKKHRTPQAVSEPWTTFVTQNHPGATRNPALGADWVLAPVQEDILPDAIVDARHPSEIIGASTRACESMIMRQ